MTVFNFTPTATVNYAFTPVLDGQEYNALVVWNLFRADYYLLLSDLSGNVVWYGPLTGSPLDSDILLAPGIFTTSTLAYQTPNNQFIVTP